MNFLLLEFSLGKFRLMAFLEGRTAGLRLGLSPKAVSLTTALHILTVFTAYRLLNIAVTLTVDSSQKICVIS